ncbi:MAG: hypothetical protein GY696_09795 [Gammaproteobacteria bacterium]|nr:hypothetical protein [Gammaproteobacteria bacterium]
MPPDLRTDPDEELEEFNLPPEPAMGEPSPPPERVYNAPHQLRERRFVETPGGHPAMDGEWMNKLARARQPPRGSRIDGPPLRCCRQPWQEEEEDLFAPDQQDEGMEEDQEDQDDHLLPELDQEPLEGLPEEEDVDMED